MVAGLLSAALCAAQTYTIAGTGQTKCCDNSQEIPCPQPGRAFFGQDAQNAGYQPAYTISADGLTVYDNNTGLTSRAAEKVYLHVANLEYQQSVEATFAVAGINWRGWNTSG